MANSLPVEPTHTAEDAELWQSLKSAIAASSGFQRWRVEQLSSITTATSDEHLVRLYLLDTLETLAY